MLVTQISIELSGLSRFEYVVAKQGDDGSRIIQITLLNNGKIYVLDDMTVARAYVKKPDGKEVIADCPISNNVIELELTKNMLACAGSATVEILLTNNSTGDILTSAEFELIVYKFDASKAESSTEYESLKEGLKRLDAIIENGGSGSGENEGENESGTYILPVASESKLGGVKPVTKTDSMVQSVGVDSEGRLYTAGSGNIYNANLYGVTPDNTGAQNSQTLQSLIDKVSGNGGGMIYIPAGTYIFAANGTNSYGERCVKLKNNVFFKGDGVSTVLKPSGQTEKGLDMFYFNDYVDTGNANYLENCIFKDFVIDGADSSCTTYISAGKGFMINLFKNCHWRNVIVKNTDGSGFGVDCPVDSSIVECVAVGCGKAAEAGGYGASGFGIGFGYSKYENIYISKCRAESNKNFGFFFEHQRRFNPGKYTADFSDGFLVDNCTARENYYNFGAIQGISVEYRDCFSTQAQQHGYYFENSNNCSVIASYSVTEVYSSFCVVANDVDDAKVKAEVKDIFFLSCISKYTTHGAVIANKRSEAYMERIAVQDCIFSVPKTDIINTTGELVELYLTGNTSTSNALLNIGTVTNLVEKNNSWNAVNSGNTGNSNDNLPWSGKTFVAFGTSITYLCQDHSGGYLEKIKELCGFSSYRNLGVSGAPMVNNTVNGNGINYAIRNATITEDLSTIEIPTNDFKLNVPRGNVYTTNVDTFAGALKDGIEYLLTNNPAKPIVIICDPQRNNDGYDVNYVNSAGYRLVDYVDTAIRIGNAYGIPVVDLYRNSGITALTLDTYTVDGLHENAPGYDRMGITCAGVINTMHGAVLPAQKIDNIVAIGEDWYDISEFKGMEYKMIVLINGTYYMYQSHYPIYIYESTDGYSETFASGFTSRSVATDKVFGNASALSPSGVTYIDDLYCYVTNIRTLNQFICANHDVKLWGTDTVALMKSFD